MNQGNRGGNGKLSLKYLGRMQILEEVHDFYDRKQICVIRRGIRCLYGDRQKYSAAVGGMGENTISACRQKDPDTERYIRTVHCGK